MRLALSLLNGLITLELTAGDDHPVPDDVPPTGFGFSRTDQVEIAGDTAGPEVTR